MNSMKRKAIRTFAAAMACAMMLSALAAWPAVAETALLSPAEIEAGAAAFAAAPAIPQFADRWAVVNEAHKKPVMDGKLEEQAWNKAASLSPFVTMYFNQPAKPATGVKLAYDATHLYIGISGQRAAANEALKAEWVEIVLSPAGAGDDYYHIPVVIAQDGVKQGNMNFDTPPEIAVKEVPGVTTVLAGDAGKWTAELAVPFASLGVQGVKAGDEWRMNVVRVRPGADPVSSWFPLRHSAYWYEGNGDYTLAATGITEGRLGSVFFQSLPSENGEKKPRHFTGWVPPAVKLSYKGFSQKELAFESGNSFKPEQMTVNLLLKSPSGKWTPIDDAVLAGDKKSHTVTFTHPPLDEYGAYQLKLTLAKKNNPNADVAFIAFDREQVIAAGESAWHPDPGQGARTKIEPAPVSDKVKRLLDMIPQQPGVYYAALPEKPELDPYNLWDWDPEKPNQLTSKNGQLIYPNAQYPENKTYKSINAKRETVEFPYYEDDRGRRYYITAHLWYKQREYVMKETLKLANSDPLGAARLLNKFADVYQGYVPVYDYPWLSFPADSEAGPPYPYYGGTWSFWFYLELSGRGMGPLIEAYEKVKQTDALAVLSAELHEDVERKLIDDVFKPSAEYLLSFPIWHTNMDYTAREGLIRLGKAIGYPDYVHDAIERMEKYTQSFFLFDGFWNEVTLSYHNQSTNGTLANIKLLNGYTDPAGYISSRFGKRADNLDMAKWFPALDKSQKLPSMLTYPDGKYLPIQDTWASTSDKSPNLTAGSLLMPASGIARLSAGESTGQAQLYMMFEPKYGHAHYDPLNIALYANSQELLPDLGYTHTKYRAWTTMTLAHNTVVVDGKDMTVDNKSKHGGSIELFEPQGNPFQVMRARQDNAYPGVSEYRREPWVIQFEGAPDNAVYMLDLFRVSGGSRHEYTLGGDANRDAEMRTNLPVEEYGPYLLPEGTPVVEPQTELDQGSAGGEYPGYLYVRDVKKAELTDGSYEATLTTQAGGAEAAGMKISGFVAEGGSSEMFLGRSPSLRATRVNDIDTNEQADKYTMPKMVLRREGANLRSTFVTALEPYAAGSAPRIAKVEQLKPDLSSPGDVAVSVAYGNTTDIVLSSSNEDGQPLVVGDIVLDGEMGFIRLVDGKVTQMTLIGGTRLQKGDEQVNGSGPVTGAVDAVRRVAEGAAYNALVTAAAVPQTAIGQYAVVTHPDGSTHGYPITGVVQSGGKSELLTGEMDPGFTISADGSSGMKFFPFTSWSGGHTFRIDNMERK
ncbi:heparinase II/III family protein [Paenibacillus sp. GCM10027626]|uniref:heparinase II/III domain-containing protein n=1 Tax=Paenibacillus sp. GCM10027626 TaxID=3273411 RepID=UPI0036379267